MPKIPAICNRCGQVRPSEVNIKDTTMHIRGHKEGLCPCGGTFSLLDGTYVHLGGPINLCNAQDEDIARFKQALLELAAL